MEEGNGKSVMSQADLRNFASALVGRADLMAKMGLQYNGDRDIYRALGYPTQLAYDDFYGRYVRQDMAKAIIDRPVRATWQGPVELIESEKTEDTAFEKAWLELDRRVGIKTKLAQLDRLTGIGRYGILLLGLDDVSDKTGWSKPVKKGNRILHYVKPFGEKSAKVKSFETNPSSPRYGMPKVYTIETIEAGTGISLSIEVHYTRLIHVTDDPLESEIYGTPRLEAVYNRLMDLDKLVGGDAEMFWRGARPGYEGKVDKDYTMPEEVKNQLKDQIDEYENNLRRFLVNEGVELKALAQQIADPKTHYDIQVACISAVTGIPQRVLMGSERGELASTQDTSEWKEYVQARRGDHAEPNIVRPLADKFIELGILPKPSQDYTVKWSDLYSLSEKARVEIGKARANALREYTYTPMAQAIVPPKAFFEKFLGFTTEDITLITAMADEMMSEEERNNKIIEAIDAEQAPPPVAEGEKKTTPKKDE